MGLGAVGFEKREEIFRRSGAKEQIGNLEGDDDTRRKFGELVDDIFRGVDGICLDSGVILLSSSSPIILSVHRSSSSDGDAGGMDRGMTAT